MIRVLLPLHLQTLAGCEREVELEIAGKVSRQSILDALECRYPMLRGTVREHDTLKRRPRVRFFADGRDVTFEPPDVELPVAIRTGDLPFMIVGAISGG
jgi:molybdopterin synthase sulfur carrier subunit